MTRLPSHSPLARSIGPALLVASIGALSIGPVSASGVYTETFSGTTYKDAAHTTATWDTVTARLHAELFQPSLAGGFDTPGSALGVARVGTLAYVADGASGLEIYDVRNPASITLVGSLALPGTAYDVVVRGTVAYVADGTSGLKIVNVANPASPALLATYSAGTSVRGLAVTGTTVLLACDTGGLRVVNVTNPAAPALLGSLSLAGNAYGVAVSGLTAYVATNTAGVMIVSFSNPASPSLVGSYNTPGNAVGVAVTNFRVYVADGASGVEILDATNPASVSLLGTFAPSGPANGLTVVGTVLYVAADAGGLQVVNASNPASPVLLNACDTPGNANAVALDNDLAFVADQASGLRAVRIGTRQRPRLGNFYHAANGNNPQRLTAVGNLVYTAGMNMEVLDVGNHAGPSLLGYYLIGGGDAAMDIAVSGPRAYLAVLNGGLRIINVTNPASPVLWGSLTGFNGIGVAVSGSVAYVASGTTGLKIVNATNPASPTLLGAYDTPGYAYNVAVSGTVACVADGDPGLQILNVGNPATPTLITTVAMPSYALEVVVSGSLAFVATGLNGLQIVDISNPATAHIVGAYGAQFDSFRGLAISGSLLYMFGGKLLVLDVSNPAAPVRVWGDLYGDPSVGGTGSALCGSLLYATDTGNQRMQTLEVVQQRFDSTRVTGQSLPVNRGQWLDQMRISSTTVDSVSWELSVDGGGNWAPIVDSYYFSWTMETTDLRWRGTLLPVPPSVTAPPPEASSLTVYWDATFARIDSLWDVRNDQGGKLRIRFQRSFFEPAPFPYDPSYSVTGYEIYHRIDDPGLVSRVLGEGSRPDPASLGPGLPAVDASSLRRWGERTFVRGGVGAAPGRPSDTRGPGHSRVETFGQFPPGLWEAVQWIPGFQLPEYYALLPTTVDSTADGPGWSVFFVAALTSSPYYWYASPPESAQSIDNLAPNVPTGFAAAFQPGGTQLQWNASSASDFRYFKIYRGTDPGFTPGPGSLVHATIGTAWVDTSFHGGPACYKLTAVDFAGNESPPASTLLVAGVEDAVPLRFALHAPAPNPFRGATAIPYDVPAAGSRVEISVYDVSGRRVRSLLDATRPAGAWRVAWDGRDGLGRALPPGLYLCRMRSASFSSVVKIALSR